MKKKKIVLVSCGRRKRKCRCRAREMYLSDRFMKDREYAEREGGDGHWFILSAKHGLLPPDTQIEPYDKSLNNSFPHERRAWSLEVFNKLTEQPFTPDEYEFIILADEDYYEFLQPVLREKGFVCKAYAGVKELNECKKDGFD